MFRNGLQHRVDMAGPGYLSRRACRVASLDVVGRSSLQIMRTAALKFPAVWTCVCMYVCTSVTKSHRKETAGLETPFWADLRTSTREVFQSIFSQIVIILDLYFQDKNSEIYSFCNCFKSVVHRNVVFGICLQI